MPPDAERAMHAEASMTAPTPQPETGKPPAGYFTWIEWIIDAHADPQEGAK